MSVPSYNVNVNSVLEVSIRGKHDGQRTLTVLHYKITALPGSDYDGPTLLDQAYTELDTGDVALFAGYKALCCSVWLLEEVRLQWIHPTRYAYKSYAGNAGSGDNLNDCFPANTSIAIERRSIFAGRSGYGITHMPAIAINKVVGSEVTTTDQTSYKNYGNKLCTEITPATGVTLTPVLFRSSNPANGNVPTSAKCQREVRIMRRRTVGVGE
jgi:hypothetical protein